MSQSCRHHGLRVWCPGVGWWAYCSRSPLSSPASRVTCRRGVVVVHAAADVGLRAAGDQTLPPCPLVDTPRPSRDGQGARIPQSSPLLPESAIGTSRSRRFLRTRANNRPVSPLRVRVRSVITPRMSVTLVTSRSESPSSSARTDERPRMPVTLSTSHFSKSATSHFEMSPLNARYALVSRGHVGDG